MLNLIGPKFLPSPKFFGQGQLTHHWVDENLTLGQKAHHFGSLRTKIRAFSSVKMFNAKKQPLLVRLDVAAFLTLVDDLVLIEAGFLDEFTRSKT